MKEVRASMRSRLTFKAGSPGPISKAKPPERDAANAKEATVTEN